uniref:Uncharacterized protein n=1 Tax=Oryctolagus cuniculus TaxID=9986 RepID=A0A5F9CQ19_RABIT
MGACWTSLLTLRLPETGLGAVTLHQPQRTGRGPAWWPQCSSNFLGACSRGLHSTLQLWGWRWGWSRGFCGQQPGGGLWGAVKQDCAAVGGQASMQPGPLGKPRARPWPLLRLGLVSPQTLCTKATMQTVRAADTNEVVKLIFRESDNDRKVMLQLEKKLFDYVNQEVFRDNNGTALLEFDKELSVFKDRLCELDISFPPSRRVRTKWSPTTTSGPASAWETTRQERPLRRQGPGPALAVADSATPPARRRPHTSLQPPDRSGKASHTSLSCLSL